MNGLSTEELIRVCRTEEAEARKLVFLDPAEFAVHHLDHDHTNNAIGNLQPLRHGDHARAHDPAQHLLRRPRTAGVRTIERHGYEHTYDLVCTPENPNFVANGIIVHNSGKSLIYMTASRLLDARTLILVSTKGLQEQLVADFESLGVTDMRGLSNYRCVAVDRSLRDFGRRGAMCDEGPCRAGVYCSLRHEGGCLYYDAQANARDAQIVVTNYSYWMTLGQFSDPLALGAFDLLVLDEAHAAPDLLSDFCAVHLIPEEIKRLLDQTTPSLDESLSVWVDWARNALSLANIKLLVLQERLRGSVGQERAEIVRATLRLNDIGRGLERLAGAMSWRSADSAVRDLVMPGVESGWVREAIPAVGRRSQSIRFTPVWAHAYAEPVLFRGIKKVLLLSATLTQDTSKYLGIAPADMDYREMRSTFDPRRRPLIYVPTVRVDRSMNEGAKRVLVNRIDKVIGDRLDRKGIIHTRSYERAREIIDRSRYSDHMMTHTTGTLRDIVAAFKAADAPAILVSPSVETGFDFPHDECRYQVIAKVPFIDGRSPLIKARAASDKSYLNHVAAITLIQQCGRGMRSESDLAETFIFDDHFQWFRRAATFPRWFRDSWRVLDVVPPPPPLPNR